MLVHQGGGWLIDRTRFSARPAESRAPTFIPPRAGGSARTCPFSTRSAEEPAEGAHKDYRERKAKSEGTSVRVKGQAGEIAASRKMTYNWAWLLLLLLSLVSIGTCLPTSLMEDTKKADQVMKPKSKRTQEILMFGNQQNRQVANAAATAGESFTSNAEKRTLAASGLGGLKAALAEDDKPSPALKSPSNAMYEHEAYSPYDKNYDYSKVMVNEVEEDIPRVWDTMPYSQYYASEDRRKRSERSTATVRPSTTWQPPTSSFQTKRSSLVPTEQPAQVKRSVPFYQEPRYKRELSLDINPNDMLTLLSLWENEQRNGNWRKYPNEEYEIDDGDFLDDEDARNALPWLTPVYPSRHYDTLSPSDIGIVRTHPPSYYEQYGKQLEQYEDAAQYGNHVNPQYDFLYPQRAAYYPQKRFMVSKKRTQSYDPYSAAQLRLSSQPRSYQYPHRMVY
ncbi:LOW QUALITY PROTEIN: prohormone-2 [Temnothorax nylanderi]|uniref:LOW QUALITY PROTEIN: prohormone-2 n=1 Tax=Temnothorax nylanderi TaxID=102681 RepID=UPI003A8B202C